MVKADLLSAGQHPSYGEHFCPYEGSQHEGKGYNS